MKKSVSIIIPAYNESETIANVLSELNPLLETNQDWEVIVVDDGSVDGTKQFVASPFRLVQHPSNRGHGAALKTGLKEAHGDTIVVFDADGQHDRNDIFRLLKLYETGIDLVVGNRRKLWWQKNGRGNTAVSLLASLLSGLHIPDLTSGLRVLSREKTLEFLRYVPDRFCFELTTTMGFALKGYKVGFVDIEPRVRQGGASKISVIWDGLRFSFLMFRLVFFIRPLRFLGLSIGMILLLFGFWKIIS